MNNQQRNQARREKSARLLFILCFSFCLLLIALGGVDYALSFARPTLAISASSPEQRFMPVRSLPEAAEGAMDINSAQADDFQTLPGIGPVLAQAIVDYREEIGGFYFVEELMDVPGIGEKRFSAIRERVFCLPPSP